MKITSKLARIGRRHKKRRRQKTSYPIELVENAAFNKPVLNKIMATHG